MGSVTDDDLLMDLMVDVENAMRKLHAIQPRPAWPEAVVQLQQREHYPGKKGSAIKLDDEDGREFIEGVLSVIGSKWDEDWEGEDEADDAWETELNRLLRRLVESGVQTEAQVTTLKAAHARGELSAQTICEVWSPRITDSRMDISKESFLEAGTSAAAEAAAAGGGAGGSTSGASAAAGLATAAPLFEAGNRVRLCGLSKAAELNGEMGVVLGQQSSGGGGARWQVELDRGISRAIRGENLELVDAGDPHGIKKIGESLPTRYGPTCDNLVARGTFLMATGDHAAAAAAFREAIESLPPDSDGYAYSCLAHALRRGGDHAGAYLHFTQAAELIQASQGRGEMWATYTSEAFKELMARADLPRPAWWNDEQLLALSEQAAAVAQASTGPVVWLFRAAVLAAEPRLGDGIYATRTAAQYHEAAACYVRAADKASGTAEEKQLRKAASDLLEFVKQHGRSLDFVQEAKQRQAGSAPEDDE